MPSSTHVQTNFTAGEFSPRLIGRTDLKKYNNAAEEVENFFVQKHGGLIRRSGSRFVTRAVDFDPISGDSLRTRLIDFQFSVDQTYILEFGNLFIKFYRDKGQLKHGALVGITDATHDGVGEATFTALFSSGTFTIGDQVSITGVVTDYAFNSGRFNGTFVVLSVPTSSTFTVAMAVDALPGGALYVSGGVATMVTGDNRNDATSVITPYKNQVASSELSRIKVTQSADILYICHPNHPPQTLSRGPGADADPASWTFAEFNTIDGPYLPENTVEDANILIFEIGGAGGGTGESVTIALTSVAAAAINDGLGFDLIGDIGRLMSWQSEPGEDWTWAIITSITNELTCIATLQSPTPVPPNFTTSAWRMGSWSITTGFPRTLTFHQSRLWFGANDNQPQTLWASRVGDFNNFVDFERVMPEIGVVLADHALVYTIDDDRVNTIHWLVSEATGIAILTNGGVFIGGRAQNFEALGPLNFTVTRQLTDGADEIVEPHTASEVTLFAKNGAFKILEFVFRFEDDRFVAPDLTLLSEHISLGGFTDSAYQSEPDKILWLVRADGVLIGMTYERVEQVVAWHRHVIGGTLIGSDQPRVISIAVIRDGDDDQLWLIVERTINGVTVHYIEFLPPLFADDETAEDALYSDAGASLGSPLAIKLMGDVINGTTDPVPGLPIVIVTAENHGIVDGDTVRLRNLQGPATAAALNDRSYTASQATMDQLQLLDANGVTIKYPSTDYINDTGAVYKEVTSVGGLEHLAGETVKVLANGSVHPDLVVTGGGGITLDNPASIVHVGLGYRSRFKSMPLVPRVRMDMRGADVRVDTVLLQLNRTIGGSVGSDVGLDLIVTRKPTDTENQPTPLFTGLHKQTIRQRTGEQVSVIVEIDDPTPLNLLSIISKLSTDEV